MLPSKNRLRNRKDLGVIHRQGRFFSSGSFSLKKMLSEKEDLRVAFSVGLSFSKKAVERNGMKRRMREIVRKNLSKIKRGYDLIIMAKKSASELDTRSLEREMMGLFQKANLIIKRIK
jgi:ribonuclease P protein component